MTQNTRLLISIALNFFIAAVEIIAGIWSGSLSLVSDALHNISDVFSLLITFFALQLSRLGRSEKRTFGYKRAEIMAAFINSSLLLLVSSVLFKEAIFRLKTPSPVNSIVVITVALFGFVINMMSVLLLKKHSHQSLNIRSSYIHLFTDALTSVSVAIGGAGMYFLGWYWLDSVLTLLIGGYVLKQGIGIFLKTLNILMQNVPEGFDMREIQNAVEKISGVKNIHHVHLWQLTEKEIHFEAHVNLLVNITVQETMVIKDKIEELLSGQFNVIHSTLQFEYEAHGDQSLVRD